MTEERKGELRGLLEEAMRSLEVRYRSKPVRSYAVEQQIGYTIVYESTKMYRI